MTATVPTASPARSTVTSAAALWCRPRRGARVDHDSVTWAGAWAPVTVVGIAPDGPDGRLVRLDVHGPDGAPAGFLTGRLRVVGVQGRLEFADGTQVSVDLTCAPQGETRPCELSGNH